MQTYSKMKTTKPRKNSYNESWSQSSDNCVPLKPSVTNKES